MHIAGTNGKGSVAAYVQSILVEQGYKVGATYSPYVYDVRERVQLGRDLISKEDFAAYTERLLPVASEMDATEFGGPTEFEMKTALGFLYWAEKGADWVALEVGLGGRLDATNVVEPACSVVTSIGLDHTQHLGDTLAKIAYEKAGIIKQGRPVVLGALDGQALSTVREVALERQAPVWEYGRDVHWEGGTVRTPRGEYPGLAPGIKGRAQGHNLALAIAAIEAAGALRDPTRLAIAASRASLPGRFETLTCEGRRFVLDGAHNPQAAEHLVQTLLDEGFRLPLSLITGRLQGHEVAPFYEALKPAIEKVWVARIDFHRTLEPQEVVQGADALRGATVCLSSREALDAALQATKEGDVILVTGSFYVVGEIGNLIRSGSYNR